MVCCKAEVFWTKMSGGQKFEEGRTWLFVSTFASFECKLRVTIHSAH